MSDPIQSPWTFLKTQLPEHETECLVLATADRSEFYRAPVCFNAVTCDWVDEWGHKLDVIAWIAIPPFP